MIGSLELKWKDSIPNAFASWNNFLFLGKALISDFYEMDGKIKEQYQALKGHIQRIQNSLRKF